MTLTDMEYYFGPDTEREVELKKQLVDLQNRYQLEAKPIIDELAQIHSCKTPRIVVPKSWLAK